MAGCLIAAVTYFPIFKALTKYANPAIFAAQATNPVTVVANDADCSFQFDPIGKRKFTELLRRREELARAQGDPVQQRVAPAGTVASVKIGSDRHRELPTARQLPPAEFKAKMAELDKSLGDAVKAAGYPAKADMARSTTRWWSSSSSSSCST